MKSNHKVTSITKTIGIVEPIRHVYEVRGDEHNAMWSFTITATYTGDSDADDNGRSIDCSYWNIEVHAGGRALRFLAERSDDLRWMAEHVSAVAGRDDLDDFEIGLQESFGVPVR